MFAQLSTKIEGVLSKLGNTGRLRESDLESAVREVRLALLEADVNVGVVRDFVGRVKDRAVAEGIIGSLTPRQHFFRIVQEELIRALGGSARPLVLREPPPHVILMVGLQGSGKTTTSAKLALHFKKNGRRPLLVPADFNRPAAVEQLKTLAGRIGVPVLETGARADPVKTVKTALDEAKARCRDIVIVDTAGRLHADESLMDELKRMKKKLPDPHILFVADAMTGQEAVNVAKGFHEAIGIEGVILTKMDGDAKGGAALSIQAVANCPIHFVGTGERPDDLEPFEPSRLVSRLLDRGDILTLAEKASEVIDEEAAGRLRDKLKKREGFDLEDFREQLAQMKKLGNLGSLMKFIPGARKIAKMVNIEEAERELKKKEAIIASMTPSERREPKILNGSRRSRIAKGSGTAVSDINRFMREFDEMRKMMKSLGGGGKALTGLLSRFGM